MIGLLTEKYTIEYILDNPHELEIQNMDLIKSVTQINTLCGPKLETTVLSIHYAPVNGSYYLKLSNDSTYCNYYPDDYGITMVELGEKIINTLEETGEWLQ